MLPVDAQENLTAFALPSLMPFCKNSSFRPVLCDHRLHRAHYFKMEISEWPSHLLHRKDHLSTHGVRTDFSEGKSEVGNHTDMEKKKKKSIFTPTVFRTASIQSSGFPPFWKSSPVWSHPVVLFARGLGLIQKTNFQALHVGISKIV